MKKVPGDIDVLAKDLGISGAHLRGLYRKHGAKLLGVLQKQWVNRVEKPRYLHKDMTRGYTTQRWQRLRGEPEAVPEEYQNKISLEARRRDLGEAA